MLLSSQWINRSSKTHQLILNLISQIQQVIRFYSQSRAPLTELSEVLLIHWGYQRDEFYQVLFDYYSSEREKMKTLEFLVHDLKETKIEYLTFYEQYLDIQHRHKERSFPKDFLSFSKIIMNRNTMEEEYLFPLIKYYSDHKA